MEYTFKTKLFSHSSKLYDKNSNIVASLLRTSWWRMDFELTVNGKVYQLCQRFLETELTLKGSEICFHTNSGMEFFNKSVVVTRLKSRGLSFKKSSLDIYDEEHWLALLVATCLECYSARVSG